MQTVGIICEYNPFHAGHWKQFELIRKGLGPETAIVCLMSGNFVQRGAPAIVDKSLRAKAAIVNGADLVLELPVTCALSSAEGFAAGGVGILSSFCDYLCFGSETGDSELLLSTARALLSEEFPPLLRQELEKGRSFPAARQAALEAMGADSSLLSQPNDILAVEYCKAILCQNCAMVPLPIRREGSYHAETPDLKNPSATSLRQRMLSGQEWEPYIPHSALFENAPLHSIAAGERAILGKLRTMTDAEFEALPYGSEGLWRKFMHASRSCATLEEIVAATKSKRYTRTRIDRMVMCAFLGITKELLNTPAPYTRVLGFTDRGREILRKSKDAAPFVNAGQRPDSPYWSLESRCGALYGLFQLDAPASPDLEAAQRIYYHKENS